MDVLRHQIFKKVKNNR